MSYELTINNIHTLCSLTVSKVAGVLFITHIVASLVTSIMDPAEAAVRDRRSGKVGGGFLRAVFDRKKHARVIENHHCNLCDLKV